MQSMERDSTVASGLITSGVAITGGAYFALLFGFTPAFAVAIAFVGLFVSATGFRRFLRDVEMQDSSVTPPTTIFINSRPDPRISRAQQSLLGPPSKNEWN